MCALSKFRFLPIKCLYMYTKLELEFDPIQFKERTHTHTVREIGFSDWGGQKNFSEARLFSPKNPRNFSQARVFSPKIPPMFSKARFFPLKFSNFWGIWAPKQLSKAEVEQARVIYYLSYTSEARRGKNIGGAMAPPLPPSLQWDEANLDGTEKFFE